jgi:hypothetical protein
LRNNKSFNDLNLQAKNNQECALRLLLVSDFIYCAVGS